MSLSLLLNENIYDPIQLRLSKRLNMDLETWVFDNMKDVHAHAYSADIVFVLLAVGYRGSGDRLGIGHIIEQILVHLGAFSNTRTL